MKHFGISQLAKEIFSIEALAISRLRFKVGKDFEKAVQWLAECKGRVILTGMGKPGFIARKIAATMASTGTPSLYLHPAEAVHGDFGVVTSKDIVIAISQSGESEEIVRLLPLIKRKGVPLIALTSLPKSSLGRNADIVLDLGVRREACPLNLAPSASTTASLAMGDALALCLLKKRGFRSEDFAELHPAGSLGRRLLRVKDIMRTGKANPLVRLKTTVRQALLKITSSRAGGCTLVDPKGKLLGVFTDGDLRRHLRTQGEKILNHAVEKLATLKPRFIHRDKLAEEAFHIMESLRIDELPVVDDQGRVVGLLDVQDLMRAGRA
ncbi:MAG TPA: KpsF/GutQ family sugar-phosphate isomerase [Candidatus Omnitrophota bacterium]|nr:KpsF/GutQ family sugar-phosphate isomerase [Candidatus Omnitrophota bacterium]HPS36117.1 KpsF/GutQ family sugar-phosphate isomerase [Candidatus Omnitrophota bacterium]